MRFKFKLSQKDLIEFKKFHYQKKDLKKDLLLGGLMLLLLVYYTNYKKINLVLTFVMVLFFVTISFLIVRRKIYNLNGINIGDEAEYLLEDEGIFYKTKDSEGRSGWSIIKSLQKSEKAFYLYTSENTAIVFPKVYFKSLEQQLQFENFVLEKIK